MIRAVLAPESWAPAPEASAVARGGYIVGALLNAVVLGAVVVVPVRFVAVRLRRDRKRG